MTNRVILIARISSRPEKVDELRGTLIGMVRATRPEAGCVAYNLHEGAVGEFTFYEIWASEEHFQTHLRTPHVVGFLSREGELLNKPVELQRLTLVEP